MNRDRYHAVVCAANLIALAVVYAGPVHPDPSFDRASRNGISLHTERRNEETVDHVPAGRQDQHVLSRGNHDAVVHIEVAEVVGLLIVAGLGTTALLFMEQRD